MLTPNLSAGDASRLCHGKEGRGPSFLSLVRALTELPHRLVSNCSKGHSDLPGGLTSAATLFLLLLQHLYNLVHLDLSYNKLSSLEGVHTKLGNVKTLNLAGNFLESLSGLHKLYSLVNVDLRDNRIEQVSPNPEGLRI